MDQTHPAAWYKDWGLVTVRYEDGNINEARGLSLGTRLFGLNHYWAQVQGKGAGWVSVVRLRDERWLDAPVYGAARSRGSSWLHLDTIRKKVLWLSKAWEPERPDADAGRSIPAGVRFWVLRRDNYTCRYCGATAPEVPLHVDHVVPWVEVRRHEITNLLTACQDCNLGKSSKALTPEQVAGIHAENERRAWSRDLPPDSSGICPNWKTGRGVSLRHINRETR